MQIPFWTQHGTIDLAMLRSKDLTAEKIGDSLAKINRFNGRTHRPWSVAAHSVLVAQLCDRDLRPWALLHDAHEVFIGDITSPSVEYLCLSGTRSAVENALANAKGKLDRTIGAAWNVAVRSQNLELRRADHIALHAEAVVFLNVRPELSEPDHHDLLEAAVELVREMEPMEDWRAAKSFWLDSVYVLAGVGMLCPPAHDPQDMSSAET